jgi:hypothetical protein
VRTDAAVVDVGRGVTLRWYDEDDLQRLGIGPWALQDLRRDTQASVHDFRDSQHVLVVEDRTPKRPDELIMVHSGLSVTKSLRALTALRLLAPGDIQIGSLWFERAAGFNVGVGGGVTKSPIAKLDEHHFGEDFVVTSEIAAAFGPQYDLLGALGESQKRLPGNFELALRAFNDSYERS